MTNTRNTQHRNSRPYLLPTPNIPPSFHTYNFSTTHQHNRQLPRHGFTTTTHRARHQLPQTNRQQTRQTHTNTTHIHTGINRPLQEGDRQEAKLYFKLIQAVHHKHIADKAVSTYNPPAGMKRQVTKLTEFIRPAAPTEYTKLQVEACTANWMATIMTILQAHHSKTIESLSLPTHITNDLAKQVAWGWAEKRLGDRLLEETKRTVDAILSAAQGTSTAEQQPSRPLSSSPPPPPVGPSPSPSSHSSPTVNAISSTAQGTDTANQRPPLRLSPSPPLALPSSSSHSSPIGGDNLGPKPQVRRKGNELTGLPPTPETLSTLTSLLIPTLKPESRPQETTRRRGEIIRRTPSHTPTQTSPMQQTTAMDTHTHIINKQGDTDTLPFPPLSSRSSSPCPSHPQSHPGPHDRIVKQAPGVIEVQLHHQPTATSTDISHHTIANIITPQHIPTNIAVYIEEKIITSPSLSPSTPTDTNGERGSASRLSRPETRAKPMMKGATKGYQPITAHSEPSKITELPTPDPPPTDTHSTPTNTPSEHHTSPTHIQHTPSYHKARPGHKLHDWEIKANHPFLFIGDSNLNRIPPFTNSNIQVDSYPGACIYHLKEVLGNTPPNPEVETVVLSVGINNMDHDPHRTSTKQLNTMYTNAVKAFPNAAVYIPVIHTSPNLSTTQLTNLRTLNKYITSRFPTLLEIHQSLFHTGPDNIHWTQETANRIFKHWCAQLNLDQT